MKLVTAVWLKAFSLNYCVFQLHLLSLISGWSVLLRMETNSTLWWRPWDVTESSGGNDIKLFLLCFCFSDLEVEDAGVLRAEALPRRDHSVQDLRVQSQRGDGRQQPAVTWQTHSRSHDHTCQSPQSCVCVCVRVLACVWLYWIFMDAYFVLFGVEYTTDCICHSDKRPNFYYIHLEIKDLRHSADTLSVFFWMSPRLYVCGCVCVCVPPLVLVM